MITEISHANGATVSIYPDDSFRSRREYYGLSTDTKPAEGVKNADIFYEMDTQAVYLYDEDGGQWLQQ